MIEKALAIDGFMTERELLWLAEQAKTHNVIVEIGSYLGRSTRALGDNTPGVVYAIDDWYGPRDIELPKEARSDIFERFCKNMAGLEGKVLVCRADHAKAEIDNQPDMVFIDGDHEFPAIKRDILRWLPRLRPGGMICGHDIEFGGVNTALQMFLPKVQRVPGTSIWFYTPPPSLK